MQIGELSTLTGHFSDSELVDSDDADAHDTFVNPKQLNKAKSIRK